MPATTTKKKQKKNKVKRSSAYLTPEMELAVNYLRNFRPDVYGTSTSSILTNALLLTYLEERVLDETNKRASAVADARLQRGESEDNGAEESGTSNKAIGV